MKITINNETFDLNREEIKTVLTDNGFKYWNRVRRQGGECRLGIGAVKDYFKPNFQNQTV